MYRIYDLIVESHIKKYNKMLFLAGPRQVGKTTLAQNLQKDYQNFYYFNWDVFEDKKTILAGQHKIASITKLDISKTEQTIIVFDEIHKYSQWKNFLKGFYDLYNEKCRIIVTGSSRLDIYRKGGDSMMGRYFLYTIFPLSVAEIIENKEIPYNVIKPQQISEQSLESLWNQNGFPEVFSHNEKSFTNRWKKLRNLQLFREDERDLTKIHEISQFEILADLIKLQIGQIFNRSDLSKKLQVSVPTISRWINYLQMFFYCFEVKPWSKNIKRSLIKEPKFYLYDWSVIDDVGAKFENFIALHLKKFIQFHSESGHDDFELYFLRDKEQREVDFIVTKNSKPWFIVETKYSSNTSLSKNLYYFQQATQASHAFQVVFDLPFIDKDCFSYSEPIIVSAKTFLSQLI